MTSPSHHRFTSLPIYPVRNSYRPSLEKRKLEKDNMQIYENFMQKLSGLLNLQKIHYSDNSSYDGQLNKGKRDGVGIMEFKNGDYYFGDWKDDVFEGKGTYIFGFGDRYEGEVKGGKKDGYGEYYYASGNIYKGNF
jgi:hypothetical protein